MFDAILPKAKAYKVRIKEEEAILFTGSHFPGCVEVAMKSRWLYWSTEGQSAGLDVSF